MRFSRTEPSRTAAASGDTDDYHCAGGARLCSRGSYPNHCMEFLGVPEGFTPRQNNRETLTTSGYREITERVELITSLPLGTHIKVGNYQECQEMQSCEETSINIVQRPLSAWRLNRGRSAMPFSHGSYRNQRRKWEAGS